MVKRLFKRTVKNILFVILRRFCESHGVKTHQFLLKMC